MPGSQGELSPVLVEMLLHGQKIMLSSNWCSSGACSYDLHAENNMYAPIQSMSLSLCLLIYFQLLFNKKKQAWNALEVWYCSE